MKGRMSDGHFEVLERKRAAMHADGKSNAALQIARLLQGRTEPRSIRCGTATRNLAAAYGMQGRHAEALPHAHAAWRIHDRRVQATGSLEALRERAASAACVGIIGTLIVLDEKKSDYTRYIARQSLEYARAALQDFELHAMLHAGEPQVLEARYLPYISVTESALGSPAKGRDLALRADAIRATIERRSISWMDGQQINNGTLGAIAVSTMTGLGDAGSYLYDTVKRIV